MVCKIIPQSVTILTRKNEWDALPDPKQTFDKFYNLSSANFSKFKSMKGRTREGYPKNKTIFINSVGTVRGGR